MQGNPTSGAPELSSLELEGAFNLRDLGGLEALGGVVRRRTVFRSGHLCALSALGSAWLAELGVRTVIDLRRPVEVTAAPGPFDATSRPRGLNLPLLTDEPGFVSQPPPIAEVYRRILDREQPQFRAVFMELSRPGTLPALIHCTAGKDRTGLVIAVLLDLIGVPHEVICTDFSASERLLAAAPGFEQHRRQAIAAGRAAFLVAPAALMNETLAYLARQYGGAAGYLEAAGVHADDLQRLKAAVIEGHVHERT